MENHVFRFDNDTSSSQAHQETAKKPELVAAIDKLHSLANRDHLHDTKLSRYRL